MKQTCGRLWLSLQKQEGNMMKWPWYLKNSQSLHLKLVWLSTKETGMDKKRGSDLKLAHGIMW